jgi:PAS domain S-box-containing protein
MADDSLRGGPAATEREADSQEQFEKLFEVISRSQHNYRELIDNLDQAVFTLSAEGEVRVANRRLSEILGVPVQDLIGRRLSEFVDASTLEQGRQVLPVLRDKGSWSGIISVRLQSEKDIKYFRCWVQTVLDDGKTASLIGWARDITNEHEWEMRFAEFFQTLREGIFFSTPEGRLLEANPAFVRMLGYELLDELKEINIRDIYADPAQREELVRETAARSVVLDKEIEYRKKDGSSIFCLASAYAIRDPNGQAVRFQGRLVDITARREMERKLQLEQEFTRRLIECFPDMIVVANRDGTCTYCSERVKEILGVGPDQYLGRKIGGRAHPDDQPGLAEAFRSILSGEKPTCQVTYRVRHADESWRVLLASAAPLYEQGKIIGIIASARDVTEQNEIEKKLHQEQEFVRRLIECFPDVIVVLDAEGRFKFVSDRLKDVLGFSAEEYLGKPVGQRIASEDRSKLSGMFKNAISGRKTQEQIEIRAQHTDGTWKTLRVTGSPLFDENGKIAGMVSSGRDVTESKQLEQQLAQKEKFAAMGEMMAGAAHELNNPLTAILGVSDLLRERAADKATSRQVELILQQARRAAGIVQNLLSFSRPATVARSQIHVDEIVKEALQLEKAALDKKNIEVKYSAPATLPAIEGDHKLLSQVFVNILANAQQAIAASRDHGTLLVSLSHVGRNIRVAFTDDGAGIAPENLDKIFDPFFTTKRPGGGSGLGLTISLAVVKEHGGAIEIESTPGAGATFQVILPVAVEASAEAVSPASVPVPKSAAGLRGPEAIRGHTILIVDDEESIREIVEQSLLSRGMKVGSVGTSEAAISYLETNPCEVVLCDFNLPGMSGAQLFERLRERQGGSMPRFIFMTGELVNPAAEGQYRGKGAAMLQKPFAISALVALVAELLGTQPSPAS